MYGLNIIRFQEEAEKRRLRESTFNHNLIKVKCNIHRVVGASKVLQGELCHHFLRCLVRIVGAKFQLCTDNAFVKLTELVGANGCFKGCIKLT